MLQRTCIVLISLFCSFSPLGRAVLNLTLPGQHPDPEAVVQEIHRYSVFPRLNNSVFLPLDLGHLFSSLAGR
jgi:hypothetical protein